jgi:predicted transcriptional regulator
MREPLIQVHPLGELELEVLDHLWRAGEDDVHSTHEAVAAERGVTPNTTGSALERLHKKGLVRRHKASHAYRYVPAMTREEFAARRMSFAASGLGSLGRLGLMSAFVDLVAQTDAASLDRLQTLIDEKRRKTGPGEAKK